MKMLPWPLNLFLGPKLTRNITPQNMAFHLYNHYGRLKGTCGFHRMAEMTAKDGRNLYLYAVSVTKVDKQDAATPTKAFGIHAVNQRLNQLLHFYEENFAASWEVLQVAGVVWKDYASCIIAVTEPITSYDARETIAACLHKNNSVSSRMPRFLKRARTRGEIC